MQALGMSYMQEANAIAARLRGGGGGVLRQRQRPGASKRPVASVRTLKVLAYMRAFYDANDQLPPVALISEAFGWVGPQSAHYHVLRLEHYGHIERNAVGKWRFAREVAHG